MNKFLIENILLDYSECLIQLVTLISCGLSISVLEWSQKNLMPILVKFHGISTLALVSNVIIQKYDCDLYRFMLLEVQSSEDLKKFSLIVHYSEVVPLYNMYLFPLDIKFE